ncbi:MAG TPA: PRC-barrel domain-containing protein [Streptosporangiaceae bacterium]|nr:PRC-barrel domain-containing protein [Streptosporangiaceae bacterium]
MEFMIGARASCSDGFCGEVDRMVLDPGARVLTHLVIEQRHLPGPGRLVPLDLVEATAADVRLGCTLAEFGNLEYADETHLVEGVGPLGPRGEQAPMGIPHPAQAISEHIVPPGETELQSERVHAADGEIGRVQGLLVDADDHRLTHVLLREGHLWGRREVAIPVSLVTGIYGGIHLSVTKKQIGHLPSVR